MPRIAGVVVTGVAHHVTQRGNRREAVFFSEADLLARLRLHTRTGQPAGDKRFVARLEGLLGRVLWPRSVGRLRSQAGDAKE
jgi:putative transposase